MIEDDFVRELTRAAANVPPAQLTVNKVRERAAQLRRRRRGAAAGAVVAVVGVLAVAPALVPHGFGHRSDHPTPAAPASERPTAGTDTHGGAVLHDGVVTTPDGYRIAIGLGDEAVGQFGVLTDGRVVLTDTETHTIRVVGPDPSTSRSYRASKLSLALTMSATDEVAAWVGPEGHPEVLEAEVADPVELAKVPTRDPEVPVLDAVTGTGCAQGGCRVLAGDGSTTFATITSDGVSRLHTPEPMRITDVSPDGDVWSVAMPRADADPQFGCSGVLDPVAQRLVAENCGTSNLRFSPDGRHLAGARGDNGTYGHIEIFDLHLHEMGTYDPAPQVISDFGWSGTGHPLAVVSTLDGSRWSVVQTDLGGGSPRRVEGWVPGSNPELGAAYRLAE